MAGGPLLPFSRYPATDAAYPTLFSTGSGLVAMGVANATTVVADVVWRLQFALPPSMPTGTLKLRLLSSATATTGDLRVNPKWASVAMTEPVAPAALNAEGATTVTWGASDSDDWKETKFTLDADTAVAGEVLFMDLTFEDTSMTLAVESYHVAMLIWE